MITTRRMWIRALAGMVFVAYPALVWFGLSRWSPRLLALAMLAVFVPMALYRLRGVPREQLRSLALLPLVTVIALLLAALLDSGGYVLLVPVVVNVALLFGFGSTLRRGSIPMIERFARLQSAELGTSEKDWCRLWTRIWCAFFIFNGGTTLVLALTSPVSWWALYTGLLAYVLIGALLGLEWLMRRRRFGVTSTKASEPCEGEP
ncbi:MAG: hypothetical protein P8N09_11770 [Planctomycetota bacterium]|nr:hypothetical protein [Planctomycetota bacterium]